MQFSDSEAAAAAAWGDGVDGDGGESSSDSGAPKSAGQLDTLTDRILSTGPETPIDKVQADHRVSRGEAHLLRAAFKLTQSEGVPAIADVLLGGFVLARSSSSLSLGDDGDAQESDDEESDSPPGKPWVQDGGTGEEAAV